jgi:hypothetical protein
LKKKQGWHNIDYFPMKAPGVQRMTLTREITVVGVDSRVQQCLQLGFVALPRRSNKGRDWLMGNKPG